MASNFRIGFLTDPEMVRNPPPEYRHLRLTYCPVGIHVGSLDFPGPGFCDFTGVLLLRWAHEVWNLSSGTTRAARLIFFGTPSEIWVRRTPLHWWKVSCILRSGKQKRVEAEVLCTPERIEAALLSASRRFLNSVRRCGVWGKDCEELAEFVDAPEDYIAATRHAADQTAASRMPDPLPPALRARLFGTIQPSEQEPLPAPSIPRDAMRAIAPSFPIFCPRCNSVLSLWTTAQSWQICPICHLRIAIEK